LTIDNRIQYLVENHLREAVLSKGAKSGIAIVMDPKTGEILALANQLGFNPNHVKGLTPEVWRNRAITDVFDPGSTFKPFMVAAALEEKVITASSRFFVKMVIIKLPIALFMRRTKNVTASCQWRKY